MRLKLIASLRTKWKVPLADYIICEHSLFAQEYPLVAQRYLKDIASDAHVLYVPANSSSDVPVYVPEDVQHIYVIVAESASIILHHKQLSSATLNIYLEPYAQCVLIQRHTTRSVKIDTSIACYQQECSRFDFKGYYCYTIDVDLKLFLQGKSAHAEIALAVDGQDCDKTLFKTAQYHQAPDTTSSLLLKGLLHDNATSTHDGMINIDPQAAGADARLYSRYLLVGSCAQAYARPSLEVLNNDVQCAHGTAIGTCSDEQLFYLMSRALDVEQAKRLLCDAFLGDFD